MTGSSDRDESRPIDASGLTIAVVVSRFNPDITSGLLEGAKVAFLTAGGNEANLPVTGVPGAFEMPQAVRRLAADESLDGIITLGCLIKGETLHFEVLAHSVTQTLSDLSTRINMPLAFGLLTALDRDQALVRSAAGEHNRGAEVMRSLIEMISSAGSRAA